MGQNFRLLLAMVLVGTIVAFADTTVRAQTQSAGQADLDFAATAAQANNGEIALAKLAVQRTASPEIRMFAQRMIADHSKIGDQLAAIAKAGNFQLPPASPLSAHDQQEQQMLSGLSSHPFDVQYIAAQVADHDAAVALFEKEAKDGSNPALVKFAASALPTLKDHLKLAHRTQDNTN